MLKEIKELFKKSGIKVTSDSDEDYFNFANKDGIHCEFCHIGGGYLSATYAVDGIETQMDFHHEIDSGELLSSVKKILNFSENKAKSGRKKYPPLRLVG